MTRWGWAALLALCGLGCSASTHESGRLRLGVVLAGGQAGLLTAYDRGFFEAEGVTVDLVVMMNTTEAAHALVRGDVEICAGLGAPLISAILNGAPLVAIAELLGRDPSRLMIARDMRSVDDLKGARVAIPLIGSNTHFSTRVALRDLGLDPDRDVTMVPVGSGPPRLAALERGSVDAGLLSLPAAVVARRLGIQEFPGFRAGRVEHLYEPVAVPRQLVLDRPATLVRVLRGIVRGTRRFKSHRAEGMALLEKYLLVDDPEALAETYDYFAEALLDRPFLSESAVRRVLQEVESTDLGSTDFPPERIADMRFIEQLDAEGFFDPVPTSGEGVR